MRMLPHYLLSCDSKCRAVLFALVFLDFKIRRGKKEARLADLYTFRAGPGPVQRPGPTHCCRRQAPLSALWVGSPDVAEEGEL